MVVVPKAVYNALDEDIAHGDKALLQDAGNGDEADPLQQAEGEELVGRMGQLFQPQQHRRHGAQAADPLAQEGGPGHAVHAHAPRGHKEDVHADVAQGGDHQEQEGRAGISHGGEDARGNVVEEQEQQAAGINVEIGFRVGHELGGRVDGGK